MTSLVEGLAEPAGDALALVARSACASWFADDALAEAASIAEALRLRTERPPTLDDGPQAPPASENVRLT